MAGAEHGILDGSAGVRRSELHPRASGHVVGMRQDFRQRAEAQAECYRERSPLFRLEKAKGLRIQIEVGIEDGHKGSVPVSQSLRAFNALVKANGWDSKLIPDDAIAYITEKAKIPEDLAQDKPIVFLRKFPVLFYRQAGPVELTIFDGGHATDFVSAVRWLDWHK